MIIAVHSGLGLATRHSMSFFGHTLGRLMQDGEVTQPDLSKRAGVGQGQISRYLNEEVIPERDSFQKIATTFESDAAWDLLASWLKDLTPAEMRNQIIITAAEHDRGSKVSESERKEKPGDFDLRRLSPVRRDLLIRIAKALEKNPKIARLLEEALAFTDS